LSTAHGKETINDDDTMHYKQLQKILRNFSKNVPSWLNKKWITKIQ